MNESALLKGTILKSPELNYEVEDILGSSGFGITYKVSANVMHKLFSFIRSLLLKNTFCQIAMRGKMDQL